MAQDVVTAREVAASPDASLHLPDDQPICDELDGALRREGYRAALYSKASRAMFQLAWAVASHKESTRVTVYHLAYGLVCGHPDAGRLLAEFLGSDVHRFAGGCILQTLPMGVLRGGSETLSPAIDTARWVGAAAKLARKDNVDLQPEHFVRVVLDGAVASTVRDALKRAARTGNTRLNSVLGPRPLPPLPEPSSASAVIQHIEQIESGDAGKSGADLASVIDYLKEFEQRLGEDAGEQREALHRIEAGLPRPPSSGRLVAAIVGVLAVGGAVGMALSVWHVAPNAGNVVSVSQK